MKTLFISTYNDLLTIALLENNKLISIKEKKSERSHSQILIPTIEEILKDNQLKSQDLDEIIAINGPGSFTGVRLGITVAKTLAYTLNIPIKLIDTITALAISDKSLDRKLVKINDLKGVYYGVYENNQLNGELKYLNNEEYKLFLAKNNLLITDKQKLDIEAIADYLTNKPNINPHEVKPIYIKQIEVTNGK